MLVRLLTYHHVASSPFLCTFRRNAGSLLSVPLKLPSRNFVKLSNFANVLIQRGTVKSIRNKPNVFLNFTRCRKYTSKPPEKVVNSEKKALLPKGSEVTRLLSLAKPERYKLFGAIGLLLISSAVTISVPFAMGKVIDTIYKSSDDSVKMMTDLSLLCKVLILVFICGAAANFGRIFLMETSGQRIIKRLRVQLYQSIIRQEIAFFDKSRTGELINRLSNDASKVGNSVTRNVSDGLRSVVQVIGGVGMMFFTSVKLAGIVLTVIPPLSILAVIYGRFVRKISRQVQDSLAKSTEIAEERISSIRTVRAFAQETREIQSYASKINDVFQLTKKEALMWGIFYSSMGLSGNLMILGVLYNGGMMMSESQITVGDLSAFLLYTAYVGVSIGGLSSFYAELMGGIGASTRLWQLLDREPSIPLSVGITPSQSQLQGRIEFKNIDFSYPMRMDVPVFSGLSLEAPASSVTAIVGASGSGKSTLASLLLRYYDPDQGHVELDGQDIRELSPEWLRHQIGTVSQEPILFSSTIADNIAYGAIHPDKVSMETIEAAARTANAYNFITGFPKGFDTMVGERDLCYLRQRIALARAVLKNPQLILLDEATSALDAESEYLVQDALEKLMVGRTVITIAHRLSTIKNADNIAVLHQGKIAEIGPYEYLMGLDDGIFRKLVERQTVVS
ncbi:ATP-binding cassette sub-family B member 10, mitochondrial [Apostichopus japonicus]|uniref:ATP-binding cassette sub-family B member 10, mitochondrial n=1 Tax=Stichopus japonicus TaxID=307972 RepID=A0A2G8LMX0_STIJA|nr:ATP-binding cassette sub-family B member 10, mitochondrial [Apostichopus japonicus]